MCFHLQPCCNTKFSIQLHTFYFFRTNVKCATTFPSNSLEFPIFQYSYYENYENVFELIGPLLDIEANTNYSIG